MPLNFCYIYMFHFLMLWAHTNCVQYFQLEKWSSPGHTQSKNNHVTHKKRRERSNKRELYIRRKKNNAPTMNYMHLENELWSVQVLIKSWKLIFQDMEIYSTSLYLSLNFFYIASNLRINFFQHIFKEYGSQLIRICW